MRRFLCLGLLLVGIAFALDVDSLPVWNPSYLIYNNAPVVRDSTSAFGSNLETHGYKTMTVTVGDGGTQVDQELRLSIQGHLTDNVYIDALLSDVDRKAGEQTTATLQDVDQIYFRVESPHALLHLGDFTWHDDSHDLYLLERSTLGAMAGLRYGYTEVRGAVGSDEVNRISRTFNGVSGQREGYSLSPDGNFLSVVPNSEKVWLNGVELVRGKDYEVNYAGGLLDFKGTLIPGNDDEIRVDYDAYEDDNSFTMYAAKAKYRHPNVHIDLSGFRLENDVEKMRHGLWTDDDYRMLKKDKGEEFERDDSLGTLVRPSRTDRIGARIRLQADHSFYADFETALNRMDSNIVSDDIDGPQGRAFRWYVTSDSSSDMKLFPLSFSVYGNRIEDGFEISQFAGGDLDWNSYILKDEWDLDSSLIDGDLLHDEFGLRLKLRNNLYSNVDWGYRRGSLEGWNSSRVRVGILHKGADVLSNFALIRVASEQECERTRYEASANAEFFRGFIRPFGNMDFRYIESDFTSEVNHEMLYGKTQSGLEFVGEDWNVQEALGAKAYRVRDDEKKNWLDSSLTYVWLQSAELNMQYVQLNHVLQYEQTNLTDSDVEKSWVGDLSASFNDKDGYVDGNVAYKLGLTEEQTYISVYKAVASGTGDVRYDSLTGTFIEGVDNGDFVYEGKGRNDSVGAVLASNAAFDADLSFKPGFLFGIKHGILRDISLSGAFSSEAEDTTSKRLYFPPINKKMLDETSSGMISWNGNVDWAHENGMEASYTIGGDYEKKMSSFKYLNELFYHEASLGYHVNENHYVNASGRLEDDELTALQDLSWNVREGALKYRFNFLDGWHVSPKVRYRYGDGHDGSMESFEADLFEGSLRVGYEHEEKGDGYISFSAIQTDCGEYEIPYQMMAGYGDGMTFRLEASLSLNLFKNVSLGAQYILRFGNAEKNIFQKLSSEAKAFF